MNINFKTLPTLFVQAALVATATVLALVLVTKFVSPIPLTISQTTTNKESAFSASGKSIVTTVPDKAEVTLGISRKENSIKQAQTRANEIINTINKQLQDIGISKEDIRTQNYNIYPNYDYQRPTQDIIGYSVDISLNVSIKDFENLNKVVDLATAAGANQVGGVQFTLSDEKEREVKKEAREKAIKDAEQNAQELARLSGMKLGKVINVTEGTENPVPGPLFDRAMAQGGKGGAPTNIEPGSTTYTYTVTLSYETL
jgi:uncharacterized protein YggE